MDPYTFSTALLRPRDQEEGWAEWFRPVFDVFSEVGDRQGFNAEYSVWSFGGISLTRVSAPATRTVRMPLHLRRDPIDHWVISYCQNGATALSTNDGQLNAEPGVPFVWSLGRSSESRRTVADRLQIYLPRDLFSEIGDPLDMAIGSMLDTASGRLLADYLILLERNLPNLTPEEASRLPSAIQAMVTACVAPSKDRLARASEQIDLTRLTRVRRTVRKNLRSPSLGPDKICREASMSRSQLYRVLESEGGVARYVQRCRLAESFRILSDPSNIQSIRTIAEDLCFSDASSFSRSFRREFGLTPMEARIMSRSGGQPLTKLQNVSHRETNNFADCLRPF